MGPKTPPIRNKLAIPELLDELLDVFLPSSLSKETKLSERNLIANFITELNEVRGSLIIINHPLVSTITK